MLPSNKKSILLEVLKLLVNEYEEKMKSWEEKKIEWKERENSRNLDL